MRSHRIFLLTAWLAAGISVPAISQTQSEKVLVNVDRKGVGLQGYDPVGYFTDNHPVKGNADLSASYGGVTYYFASAEHKAEFERDPEHYAPRFGGFCAYGVSQGHAVPIDVKAFQIQEGHLLLQYSKSVQAKFLADPTGNLRKAEANWPSLVAHQGSEMGHQMGH